MRDLFITPAQLRAARAMLDWSRERCSDVSGVSTDVIRNLESERRKVSRESIKRLVDAFAARGLIFVGLDGVIHISSKLAESTPFAELNSALIPSDVRECVTRIYSAAPPQT